MDNTIGLQCKKEATTTYLERIKAVNDNVDPEVKFVALNQQRAFDVFLNHSETFGNALQIFRVLGQDFDTCRTKCKK